MPIVVRATGNANLTQGDVLKDVPFVVVGVDGKAAFDKQVQYVLVVSRPCKALRDDAIVVAPVVPYPVDFADVAKSSGTPVGGLERMRRFLAGLRDGLKGGDFSDALYLGAFELTGAKRFAAQLTTLSTASVPTGEEERCKWVAAHRVGRLDVDFLRDLHTRILLTFTRLGFDDDHWYSDADLGVMISAGEAEVNHVRGEFISAQQAIQNSEAAQKPQAQAQRDGVERKKKIVEEAEARLKPYLDERERRSK